MQEIKLQDLKLKSPTELLAFGRTRSRERFDHAQTRAHVCILKQLASERSRLSVRCHRGLAGRLRFLAIPDANYLAGPTTFMSRLPDSPFGLRTGDTVEGLIRSPRKASVISRCLRLIRSISRTRKKSGIRLFRQSDALYPDERLKLEVGSDQKRSLRARY